jgi:streptogrisin C
LTSAAATFPVYATGVRWVSLVRIVATLSLAGADPAAAQVSAPTTILLPAPVQSDDEARYQDAAAVADRLGVQPAEAARQLRFQEASVDATDAIADRFGRRLAGISVEHRPLFRIVVLLTGYDAVLDETVDVGGDAVPVSYQVGAPASHTELVQAITTYQSAIRSSLSSPPGLGVDQRTGEVVAVVSSNDVAREGSGALSDRLAALTHVPVRLRVVDRPLLDMAATEGGDRMVGSVPGDPHRYVCTAGFVVTDGARTGLATAAHCPDTLNVQAPDGHEEELAFVGQWGWGNQDVQINASPYPLTPLFFADTAKTISRAVKGARNRAGTRAGDVVCHRGERTGYSCSQVDLTDFAPAGDLCGGACLPTWTTVAGPMCKGGDSGSPVFLGSTAYGIMKGGSYRADGSCAFYFYMSIDYLPIGWRLLTDERADPADPAAIKPLPSR